MKPMELILDPRRRVNDEIKAACSDHSQSILKFDNIIFWKMLPQMNTVKSQIVEESHDFQTFDPVSTYYLDLHAVRY